MSRQLMLLKGDIHHRCVRITEFEKYMTAARTMIQRDM